MKKRILAVFLFALMLCAVSAFAEGDWICRHCGRTIPAFILNFLTF